MTSSNYKYGNQDLFYVINSTGSFLGTPYINFPKSYTPGYANTSTIDLPLPFNYKVSNVDLSNTTQAHQQTFFTPGTYNAISYSILNSSPTRYYKHISGYLYSGSGGGGGGGGAGTDNLAGGNHSKGGNGGNGGAGGYAAVVQYPIASQTINLIVGASGSGGGGGAKNSNGSGQGGGAGTPGGVSSLKIGNTTVLQGAAGAFGKGGGGGSGNGGKGSDGTTNANTTNSIATGGKNRTTDPNSPTIGYWPPNNAVAGTGGAGANWPNSADSGNAGNNGYATLWFLYEA